MKENAEIEVHFGPDNVHGDSDNLQQNNDVIGLGIAEQKTVIVDENPASDKPIEVKNKPVNRAKRSFIISLAITFCVALLAVMGIAIYVYFAVPTTMGVAMVATIGAVSSMCIFATIFIACYISSELNAAIVTEESQNKEIGVNPSDSLPVSCGTEMVSQVTEDSAEGYKIAEDGSDGNEKSCPVNDPRGGSHMGPITHNDSEVSVGTGEDVARANLTDANDSADHQSRVVRPIDGRHELSGDTSSSLVNSAGITASTPQRSTVGTGGRGSVKQTQNNNTSSASVRIPLSHERRVNTLNIAQAVGKEGSQNGNISAAQSQSSTCGYSLRVASDEARQTSPVGNGDILAASSQPKASSSAPSVESDEALFLPNEFFDVRTPAPERKIKHKVHEKVKAYIRINHCRSPNDVKELNKILSCDATHNLSYRYNGEEEKLYVEVKGFRFEVSGVTLFLYGKEPSEDEVRVLRESLNQEEAFIALTYSCPILSGDMTKIGLYATTGYDGGKCTAEFLFDGKVSCNRSDDLIYLTLMSFLEFPQKPWKLQLAKQYISYCHDEMFNPIGDAAYYDYVRSTVAYGIVEHEMEFLKLAQGEELSDTDRSSIKAILDAAKEFKQRYSYRETVKVEADSRTLVLYAMFSQGEEVFNTPLHNTEQVAQLTLIFNENSHFRKAMVLLAMQSVYDKVQADPDVQQESISFPYLCGLIPGLKETAFHFVRACLHPNRTYDILEDHMMSLCTMEEFAHTSTGKLCAEKSTLFREDENIPGWVRDHDKFAFEVLTHKRVRIHVEGELSLHVKKREEISEHLRYSKGRCVLDANKALEYIGCLSNAGKSALIAEGFVGAVKEILSNKEFPINSGKPMGAIHAETVTEAINNALRKDKCCELSNLLSKEQKMSINGMPLIGTSEGILLNPQFETKSLWEHFGTLWRSLGKQYSLNAARSSSDSDDVVDVGTVSANSKKSTSSRNSGEKVDSGNSDNAEVDSTQNVATRNEPAIFPASSGAVQATSPRSSGVNAGAVVSAGARVAAAVPSANDRVHNRTRSPNASFDERINRCTEFTMFIRTSDKKVTSWSEPLPIYERNFTPLRLHFRSVGFLREKTLLCGTKGRNISVIAETSGGYAVSVIKGKADVSHDDDTTSKAKTVMLRFRADIPEGTVFPASEDGMSPKIIPMVVKEGAYNDRCVLGLSALSAPTREVLFSEMLRLTPYAGSYDDEYKGKTWKNDMFSIYTSLHDGQGSDYVIADLKTHGDQFSAFVKREGISGQLGQRVNEAMEHAKKDKSQRVDQGTPHSLLALAYALSRKGGRGVPLQKAIVKAKKEGKLLTEFLSNDKFRNLVISSAFSHALREMPEKLHNSSLTPEQFPLLFRQIPGLTSCVCAMINAVYRNDKNKYEGKVDFLYPIDLIDKKLIRHVKGCDFAKLKEKIDFLMRANKIAGTKKTAVFSLYLLRARDSAKAGEISISFPHAMETTMINALRREAGFCENADMSHEVIEGISSLYKEMIDLDASRPMDSDDEKSTQSDSILLNALREIMTYACVDYISSHFPTAKQLAEVFSKEEPFLCNMRKHAAELFSTEQDLFNSGLFTENLPEQIEVVCKVDPFCCTSVDVLYPSNKAVLRSVISDATVSREGTQDRIR